MLSAASLKAQDTGTQQVPVPAQQQSAIMMLINKLAERGTITKQDAAELAAQANADAADARVQVAEAQLAAAKADAALARAQAAAAQANYAVKEATSAQAAAGQANAAQLAAARVLLGLPAGTPVAQAPMPPPSVETPVQPVAPAAAPVASTDPAIDARNLSPPSAALMAPVAALAAETPSSVTAPSAIPDGAAAPVAPDGVAASGATQGPSEPVGAPTAADIAAAAASVAPSSETPVGTAPVTGDGSAPPPPVAASTQAADPVSMGGTGQSGEQPIRISDVLDNPNATPSPSSASNSTGVNPEGGGAPVRVSDALGETTPAPSQPPEDTTNPAPVPDTDSQAQQPAASAPTPDATLDVNPGPAVAALAGAPARAEDTLPVSESPEDRAAVAASPPADGTVRVAYVPDVVRNQIAQEVKDEVIAQAHSEGWGEKTPGWVNRIDLYGDIRVRYESIINHSTNADDGSFPNFNAINTGAPFDTAGTVFSPQFNVDQNRNRMRLRARLGVVVDLKSGFTAGFRIATGNDDSPVTENQTFGVTGGAQGGDFSKYELWLDRGYIKYQSPGDPASAFSVTLGRFENPFLSTTMMWANDLGFDGAVLSMPLKAHVDSQVIDSVKPFIVAGVFPVFNTDLNFATNQPAKNASYDKWLEAVQAGVNWNSGADFSFKSAVALYYYKNIEGQLSTPFTPVNSTDAGDTDESRPSFAQNGNTYMPLRDIVPGPLNDNGTIDQFQYYGLATPFHDLTLTQEIDYNNFEPFKVSLIAEYVKNLAFNEQAIAATAVNNLGPVPASGGTAPFVGGSKGWLVNLKVGDVLLEKPGDWNVAVGYRHVESDSVVDGFTDADFGGDLTGTNLQGFTLSAAVALVNGVWLEGHWYSATAIAGPTYKNDTLQFDLNAKF